MCWVDVGESPPVGGGRGLKLGWEIPQLGGGTIAWLPICGLVGLSFALGPIGSQGQEARVSVVKTERRTFHSSRWEVLEILYRAALVVS